MFLRFSRAFQAFVQPAAGVSVASSTGYILGGKSARARGLFLSAERALRSAERALRSAERAL